MSHMVFVYTKKHSKLLNINMNLHVFICKYVMEFIPMVSFGIGVKKISIGCLLTIPWIVV